MKILVVFYSKTGNTKKIANEISTKLNTNIDEIIDLTNRKGIINWFRAGQDGMKKNLTKIKYSIDPAKYDLIIIGTPIWGWNMVPAIRTYLLENKTKIKKIAFFSTSGGSNPKNTFKDMENLSSKPLETISIIQNELIKNSYQEKLKNFCENIKKYF